MLAELLANFSNWLVTLAQLLARVDWKERSCQVSRQDVVHLSERRALDAEQLSAHGARRVVLQHNDAVCSCCETRHCQHCVVILYDHFA